MKNLLHFLFLFLIFVSCNHETENNSNSKKSSELTQTSPQLHWHWEDTFSVEEKEKIKKYISAVTEATFEILGIYPFEVNFYFKRSDSENSPIPWAYTIRKNKRQGVRFYINPNLADSILYSDWTAPHEISHLSIPFLGKENAWFAEGYASYMQYQIMQELGIYTKGEVTKRYTEKIRKIKSDYSDTMIFIENAKELRARYNFPAMYWGGAKYFMYMDSLLLQQEGKSLVSLIKEYQSCCRINSNNLDEFLDLLDQKLKTPLFVPLYEQCNTKSFHEIYWRIGKENQKLQK